MPEGHDGSSNLPTLSSTLRFASISNAATDLHQQFYSKRNALRSIVGEARKNLGRVVFETCVPRERRSTEVHRPPDASQRCFLSYPDVRIIDPRRRRASSFSSSPGPASPERRIHVHGTSNFGTSLVKSCDRLRRASRRPAPSDPRTSSKGIQWGMVPGSSLLLKGNETGWKFPFEAGGHEGGGHPLPPPPLPSRSSFAYRYLTSRSSPARADLLCGEREDSASLLEIVPIFGPDMRQDMPRIPSSPRVASTCFTFFSSSQLRAAAFARASSRLWCAKAPRETSSGRPSAFSWISRRPGRRSKGSEPRKGARGPRAPRGIRAVAEWLLVRREAK